VQGTDLDDTLGLCEGRITCKHQPWIRNLHHTFRKDRRRSDH